ncbi:hypothetical protein [Cesiribacter andamanensis]|uniref:Uncharacterized protein n=1 Tax=Cesiribacter andamanensis AMV16 TaxID=1279009 RepID=M7MZS1_9BACT|nr:hypothetical protein [Cesiribacter andamanensis]EMR01928.1 hypothetical protein ADICEAN_02951 [Cesiribacter andamanensis AMV16]
MLLALLLPLWPAAAPAQQKKGPAFDQEAFAEKLVLADWLLQYDAMAWQSADSIRQLPPQQQDRLGNEWFCYQTADGSWQAVYGRYSPQGYELIAHYRKGGNGSILRSTLAPDTAFLNAHGRALQTASRELQGLKASINIRFNHYIRQQPDGRFTVWIFPAFQPNGLAVYGGEYCYTLDAGGRHILQDHSYSQGLFRAFKIGEHDEARLDYSELLQPSLGTVFFARYYNKFFSSICIENARFTSTARRLPDNSLHWSHTPKAKPTKRK